MQVQQPISAINHREEAVEVSILRYNDSRVVERHGPRHLAAGTPRGMGLSHFLGFFKVRSSVGDDGGIQHSLAFQSGFVALHLPPSLLDDENVDHSRQHTADRRHQFRMFQPPKRSVEPNTDLSNIYHPPSAWKISFSIRGHHPHTLEYNPFLLDRRPNSGQLSSIDDIRWHIHKRRFIVELESSHVGVGLETENVEIPENM